MRNMWKVGALAIALLVLAGTVGGVVLAQTGGDPAGPFSNFVSRLAANLGITEQKLQDAIDQTSVDIVDDKEAAGDLTTEQADRIRERIATGEGSPFFGRFRHGFGDFHSFGGLGLFGGFGHLGAGLDDLATCLGVSSADDLRAALADKSLAQIGADHGMSRDQVKACVAAPLQGRLDQAVADGKIDQTKADEIERRLTEHLDKVIDSTGIKGFGFRSGFGDFSSISWSEFFGSWRMDSSTDPAPTTY